MRSKGKKREREFTQQEEKQNTNNWAQGWNRTERERERERGTENVESRFCWLGSSGKIDSRVKPRYNSYSELCCTLKWHFKEEASDTNWSIDLNPQSCHQDPMHTLQVPTLNSHLDQKKKNLEFAASNINYFKKYK